MGISESSKLYLKNYYLLDQARTEAQSYLERIANSVANEVDEYIERNSVGVVRFGKYVQKGGGYVGLTFEQKEPILGLESIDQWKFSLVYQDAMRNQRLSSPTKCRVYCYTPKSYGKQNYELNRMTAKLGLPDLFRIVEIELLDDTEDEVVAVITSQFIEFYDQLIQTIEGLMQEAKQ